MKLLYVYILLLLLLLGLSSTAANTITFRIITLTVSGKDLNFITRIAHVMSLNPRLIKVLDFRYIDNSTLKKLLIRTYFSRNTAIPSSKVYVKNGCLYLSWTEHLVLNTSFIGINNTNYLLIKAYVEYVRGSYPGFSRGGIGFYGTTTYNSSGGYYIAAPYWLSVIGSFNTSEPASYDFEGHITWLGGQWGFSEAANYKLYRYNKTYVLWIALLDDYVIGGIDAFPRSWVFYINGTYYLPEVVSHAGTVCIKRIEFYDLNTGIPKRRTTVLPVTILDFDTFSNLSYVYLRQQPCTQYIFDTGRLDTSTSTLYVFVRKTNTCLLLPYTYTINNKPIVYNSGEQINIQYIMR